MPSFGQCHASLRNGQCCRVVIETEGSEFCAHHARLAAEHGSDAVMNGSVPQQRSLRVVGKETKPANVAPVTPITPIVLAGVRPLLAEAAAENAERLKASLLEAAGSAVRPVEVSVLGTLQLWDAAKDTRRRDEMRACLDDGALVETVASRWCAVGADEAVEAIRTALERDPLYLEGLWLYDELAPEVVWTSMPVREPCASGAARHENVHRLTSGRAGLIWRQRLFRSRAKALACLVKHGAGLGL